MTYYVAGYGGFFCEETYDSGGHFVQKLFTTADARCATNWDSFEAADRFAKFAVLRLYPPGMRYFAILKVP